MWLVPAVDIDAAMDREAELRARVEMLEDETNTGPASSPVSRDQPYGRVAVFLDVAGNR